MILFKSNSDFENQFIYRLLLASKYWLLFMLIFFGLIYFLNKSWIILYAFIPVVILFIMLSCYESIYYIKSCRLIDDNFEIVYYKYSKKITLNVNRKDLKVEKKRVSTTYHKHYKLIFEYRDIKIKQFELISWDENKMDNIITNLYTH